MVKQFGRSESGASMVETALVMTLLLILLFGFVDFGLAFYQWNAASQAVQVGARRAAVSNPVAAGLIGYTDTVGDTSLIGEPVPAGTFYFSCTGGGTCNAGAFDPDAFNSIFYGDERTGPCGTVPAGSRPGMCDFYRDLENHKAGVRIEYRATGLGYWTRPGGPVPTIRVSLENIPFNFFFLNALLGLGQLTMPGMDSTVTGEDLNSTF